MSRRPAGTRTFVSCTYMMQVGLLLLAFTTSITKIQAQEQLQEGAAEKNKNLLSPQDKPRFAHAYLSHTADKLNCIFSRLLGKSYKGHGKTGRRGCLELLLTPSTPDFAGHGVLDKNLLEDSKKQKFEFDQRTATHLLFEEAERISEKKPWSPRMYNFRSEHDRKPHSTKWKEVRDFNKMSWAILKSLEQELLNLPEEIFGGGAEKRKKKKYKQPHDVLTAASEDVVEEADVHYRFSWQLQTVKGLITAVENENRVWEAGTAFGIVGPEKAPDGEVERKKGRKSVGATLDQFLKSSLGVAPTSTMKIGSPPSQENRTISGATAATRTAGSSSSVLSACPLVSNDLSSEKFFHNSGSTQTSTTSGGGSNDSFFSGEAAFAVFKMHLKLGAEKLRQWLFVNKLAQKWTKNYEVTVTDTHSTASTTSEGETTSGSAPAQMTSSNFLSLNLALKLIAPTLDEGSILAAKNISNSTGKDGGETETSTPEIASNLILVNDIVNSVAHLPSYSSNSGADDAFGSSTWEAVEQAGPTGRVASYGVDEEGSKAKSSWTTKKKVNRNPKPRALLLAEEEEELLRTKSGSEDFSPFTASTLSTTTRDLAGFFYSAIPARKKVTSKGTKTKPSTLVQPSDLVYVVNATSVLLLNEEDEGNKATKAGSASSAPSSPWTPLRLQKTAFRIIASYFIKTYWLWKFVMEKNWFEFHPENSHFGSSLENASLSQLGIVQKGLTELLAEELVHFSTNNEQNVDDGSSSTSGKAVHSGAKTKAQDQFSDEKILPKNCLKPMESEELFLKRVLPTAKMVFADDTDPGYLDARNFLKHWGVSLVARYLAEGKGMGWEELLERPMLPRDLVVVDESSEEAVNEAQEPIFLGGAHAADEL
ncbi:unnamed protein product [Amoebophrya sp. A120]|nr:unnamed protein product [Amoebophrya sp. A120]|eukprot:GSA120T00010107001.1